MAQKATAESNNCYMDGVRVKIAEKYKPPPKITLTMSYSQRLSLNRQLQVAIPSYDFKTDAYVMEKMRDWRTVRLKTASDRKQRLEASKHHQTIEKDRLKLERTENNVQEHERTSNMLIPTQANILTAIPTNDVSSPINISDFEPDTASPFDNLELKTLNDMEELKMVLQNQPENNPTYASSHNAYYSFVAPPSSSSEPLFDKQMLYTPLNDANKACKPFYCTRKPQETLNGEDNVTNIMKSLENQLHLNASSNYEVAHAKRVSSWSNEEKRENRLENPFAQLSQHSQAICESIATMGFAMGRVARACRALGDDEKKLVEYLLTMSQLMDLGFSEEQVAAALIQADHDRDKALEVLIS